MCSSFCTGISKSKWPTWCRPMLGQVQLQPSSQMKRDSYGWNIWLCYVTNDLALFIEKNYSQIKSWTPSEASSIHKKYIQHWNQCQRRFDDLRDANRKNSNSMNSNWTGKANLSLLLTLMPNQEQDFEDRPSAQQFNTGHEYSRSPPSPRDNL